MMIDPEQHLSVTVDEITKKILISDQFLYFFDQSREKNLVNFFYLISSTAAQT